ncbi:cuticlin-3-like [Centruroides vittatus]|uniref:cuticlin-3-like n=1 Tax=Centruroides vittatus TaxID=120091 RepID=UPI0035100DF6
MLNLNLLASKNVGDNEKDAEKQETAQSSSHIIRHELPILPHGNNPNSGKVVLPQIPYAPPANHHRVANQPLNHKLAHETNFQPIIVTSENQAGDNPYNHRFSGYPAIAKNDLWPLPTPDLPKITKLEVKCERELMKVAIEFDRPFYGLIFSKGHYTYGSCIHVPAGLGKQAVYFDILINMCGTHGDTESLYGLGVIDKIGSYFENTIIIQYDPQVQEVWDLARKLRCTWHDHYERLVSFRPFLVDSLEVFRVEFAGDDVGCWMQIQSGKGPFANEVSGIIKIGQTLTLVLAIKDADKSFDMMVRNCIAHDGKKQPIELVDDHGCISRPKLLSRFTKVKNFGNSATVLSFAHFQAFKFPDSMEVHFQCTIQICRYACPDQCVIPYEDNQDYQPYKMRNPRASRSVNDTFRRSRSKEIVEESAEVGLNRVVRVVSDGDLAFSLQDTKTDESVDKEKKSDDICISRPKFTVTVVGLFLLVIISGVTSAVLCLCRRQVTNDILAAFNGLLKRKKCNRPT